MSIHCLFCGCTENWREDAQGNSYEVEVTKETWVELKIFRDSVLGEKTTRQNKLEGWWCHRDCYMSWIQNLGAETKLNYEPKRLS